MKTSACLKELNSGTTILHLFCYTLMLLMIVILYGWSIFEPLSGDTLQHVMDANRVASVHDAFMRFFGHKLKLPAGTFTLDVLYRPIFNDFYISFLKYFFGVNPVWYRLSTLVIHVLSCLILFRLFLKLNLSACTALLGACTVLLSPSLFFGVYEFGMSNSQFIVFLAVVSLTCAHNYVQTKEKLKKFVSGLLTLIFVFLTVFAKETAVTWPFIIICFIFFNELNYNKKEEHESSKSLANKTNLILRNNLLIFFFLALITAIYFFFRYLKFGSLTAIHSGIEGEINFVPSLVKLLGYVLYLAGIPTSIFPPWMSAPITKISGLELILRVTFFVFVLFLATRLFRQNKSIFVFSILAMLIAILSVVKVTRNSPSYGDLMSIGFAFLIAFGFSAIKGEKNIGLKYFLAITLTFLMVVLNIYTSKRYIFDSNMWVARAQGTARAAMSGIASFTELSSVSKIIQVGNIGNHEVNWSINAGSIGSGFYANLGIPISKFSLASTAYADLENVLFIEMLYDLKYRRLGAGIFPGLGRLAVAFFPGPVTRETLKEKGGFYDLRSERVIRISCNMGSDDISFKPLPIRITMNNGEIDRLSLGRTFDISTDPKYFVAEILVPVNANSLFFENATLNGCSNPVVESYSRILKN